MPGLKRDFKFIRYAIIIAVLFPAIIAHASDNFSWTLSVDEPPTILVLHSYHEGFRWTDSVDDGIRKELEKAYPGVRIITEYMDSKRYVRPEYWEILLRTYSFKYGSQHLDLVISTDDNAFNFTRLYGRQIFGSVPIVFCGVNNFNDAMLEGRTGITGVVETIDVKDTLDVGLNLHPNTRHVAVVVDRTATGLSTARSIKNLPASYFERYNFLMLDDLSMPELLGRVRSLPADSIVLLLNFNRDSHDNVFSHVETIHFLRKVSKVPVYGVWDFFLGEGIVGGMITSGRAQGKVAANLARRILEGEEPDRIPVVKQSPNSWMFDYNEMNRFGISEEVLPPESRVINRPPSFYEVNKKIIWSLIGATLFLAFTTIVLAMNIIQRRRVQAELRDTAEKLASLLDSLPIVPFTTTPDADPKFVYVSHAATDITGFQPDEFLSDSRLWSSRIHPDDRDEVLGKLAPKGTSIERFIYRFQTANGDYRWFSDTRRPVSYPDSKLERVAGFWQDITAEVELRQEADLRLQQVVHADKLASLGELVAGVAHEIRNPNFFISSNVPLLRETWEMLEPALRQVATEDLEGLDINELSKDMFEMLDDVMAGSERIDRIVRELGEFAGCSEHGQHKPVQLNEIVRKALTLVGAQVRKSFTHFSLDLDEKLPLVEGHTTKLEQVVANLVVNATQAVKTDENAALKITTRWLPKLQAVALEVEDNGKGVPSELRERIFEPFFTTRRGDGGTGLGLSISYQLVQDHGGNIFIVSRPNLGSRFTVVLPSDPDRSLGFGPSLLWLDRDVDQKKRFVVENSDEAPLHFIGLDKPEELFSRLDENPQVVAVCFDHASLRSELLQVLRQLSEVKPLLTRAIYADLENKEEMEILFGDTADIIISGPMSFELLQKVLGASGRKFYKSPPGQEQ